MKKNDAYKCSVDFGRLVKTKIQKIEDLKTKLYSIGQYHKPPYSNIPIYEYMCRGFHPENKNWIYGELADIYEESSTNTNWIRLLVDGYKLTIVVPETCGMFIFGGWVKLNELHNHKNIRELEESRKKHVEYLIEKRKNREATGHYKEDRCGM